MFKDILAHMRSIGLSPRASKHIKASFIGRKDHIVTEVDPKGRQAVRLSVPHFTHRDNNRYQPADCRRLRAERGVGNPKHIRPAGA